MPAADNEFMDEQVAMSPHVSPTASNVETAPIQQSKQKSRIFIQSILAIALVSFGVVGGVLGNNYFNTPNVTKYNECVKAKGSIIQESYPTTCVTRNGQRFTQPLTDEEKKQIQPPSLPPDPTAAWKTSIEGSSPSVSPTPTAVPGRVIRPPLMDTSGWRQVQVKKVRLKVPSDGEFKITTDGQYSEPSIEGSAYYRLPQSVTPSVSIMVRAYDGDSRRQWWIRQLGASTNEVEKNLRFQEVQLGSMQALDVFADGGWWQGGYASPILVAQGKTIVAIHGGRGFHPETGEMTRYQLSDTVASTIEFVE